MRRAGIGRRAARAARGVLVGLVVLSSGAGQAAGADAAYTVIASPALALEAVSAEDLRKLFLGLKHEIDGVAVRPVLLDGGDAHRAFLQDLVAKSETGFRLYWRKQVFAGAGRQPRAFDDHAQVVAHLRGSGNVIAYVPTETVVTGVKVLEVRR